MVVLCHWSELGWILFLFFFLSVAFKPNSRAVMMMMTAMLSNTKLQYSSLNLNPILLPTLPASSALIFFFFFFFSCFASSHTQ
jgi:hypothetical protein